MLTKNYAIPRFCYHFGAVLTSIPKEIQHQLAAFFFQNATRYV